MKVLRDVHLALDSPAMRSSARPLTRGVTPASSVDAKHRSARTERGEMRGKPSLSPWGEGRGGGWLAMRSGLVQLARGLRRSETAAERALWLKLRRRQIDGWKFKRQVPFGAYILDFFCFDARLAVEVDGATHGTAQEVARDSERTTFLEANGVRVLRFTNADVSEDIDRVVEMIYLQLGQAPAPSPGALRRPLPKGRGEAGVLRP